MTEHRTGNLGHMVDVDWMDAFVAAVTGLGARVSEPEASTDAAFDLFINLSGRTVRVNLKRVSTATPSTLHPLFAERRITAPDDAIPVLVGDRIVERARDLLRSRGWSWLDLRGHLHLQGPGILVDTKVQPFVSRPERSDALAGQAGLEVAALILLHPDSRPSIRGIARELKRSPSTVSDIMKSLRNEGIIARDGQTAYRDLFWRLAGSWNTSSAALTTEPDPGSASLDRALQLGLDDPESTTGWAMTDTVAATLYGAPIGTRSDYPPDFYVPTKAVFHRALRLLGHTQDSAKRKCRIRVAPVAMACDHRIDAARRRPSNGHWPLAHPLFVALDLAGDPGRGSEILEDWNPPEPWRRVW
ncbi:MAG: winged helix-turn-helix transcriptional regulator [Actinomycetota bacterium]